jgi:hypothetical protein
MKLTKEQIYHYINFFSIMVNCCELKIDLLRQDRKAVGNKFFIKDYLKLQKVYGTLSRTRDQYITLLY